MLGHTFLLLATCPYCGGRRNRIVRVVPSGALRDREAYIARAVHKGFQDCSRHPVIMERLASPIAMAV